jgi:hypothetical protein
LVLGRKLKGKERPRKHPLTKLSSIASGSAAGSSTGQAKRGKHKRAAIKKAEGFLNAASKNLHSLRLNYFLNILLTPASPTIPETRRIIIAGSGTGTVSLGNR